ncbi:MAG: hypothetical protein P0116_12645 [Candidatus Nitrosocosmicus sp.]|nr:hypothetical protein [Candidatus Nitrosocosmicus sp.]
MAKDPACNMNVDEKTAKHVLAETRFIYVLPRANNNSIKILQNMDIDTNQK